MAIPASVMNDGRTELLAKEVTITNELGLHARSAAQIAGIAREGKGGVWLIKEDMVVDAASVIDILTLACGQGSGITVRVDCPEDLPVLDRIMALVEQKFGEEN